LCEPLNAIRRGVRAVHLHDLIGKSALTQQAGHGPKRQPDASPSQETVNLLERSDELANFANSVAPLQQDVTQRACVRRFFSGFFANEVNRGRPVFVSI
jgi:hypothetical protein